MHVSIAPMWIERCLKCHESTSSRTLIEDHETLQQNVKSVFNSHDTLPHELETHRIKFDVITSKLLRSFHMKANFTHKTTCLLQD